MPSFLLTPKMNPALRTRVLRSLGGPSLASRLPARAIAALRLFVLLSLVAAVVAFLSFRKEQATRLERAKLDLRETLARHAAGLTPDDFQTLPRALKWLREVPEAHAGDFVAKELRGEASLARFLTRRLVYVRGKNHELTRQRDIRAFAGGSSRDFLVGCLLDPVPDPSEKELLAHLARMHRASFDASDRVELLGAALAGMPLLAPEWPRRLDAIDTIEAMKPLRELVERAPLAEAKRAAQAELLLLVLDEPNVTGTAVEIDGTARHAVRVSIFDLRAEREVARLRRTVDPEWISAEQRQRRARDLVDCRLGVELRAALACAPPCAETQADAPRPASSKPQ